MQPLRGSNPCKLMSDCCDPVGELLSSHVEVLHQRRGRLLHRIAWFEPLIVAVRDLSESLGFMLIRWVTYPLILQARALVLNP